MNDIDYRRNRIDHVIISVDGIVIVLVGYERNLVFYEEVYLLSIRSDHVRLSTVRFPVEAITMFDTSSTDADNCRAVIKEQWLNSLSKLLTT